MISATNAKGIGNSQPKDLKHDHGPNKKVEKLTV